MELQIGEDLVSIPGSVCDFTGLFPCSYSDAADKYNYIVMIHNGYSVLDTVLSAWQILIGLILSGSKR